MPAMARQATRNVACVTGMYRRRPPMADISLECTAWMMHPAPRNSSALNMACVKRWNIEAMYPSPPVWGSAEVQTPSATIMKPICEMVLNASTRLMSLCTQATTAA
ncbi:unknown [Alistipes sp. CAG:29]|nr:unknown [Alistipes sp. CAG:29]